jgi:chemotaxis protein CheZ
MPKATALKPNHVIKDRLARMGNTHGEMIALREVASLVEVMVSGMRQDLEAATMSLGGELKSIVDFIEMSKRDIASISPKTLAAHDIPGAADQLDAVVQHTEEAAGQIMDCADELTALAGAAEGEMADKLNAIAMRIFEASSFQDITGQRVTKVVKTLKTLEERLAKLAITASTVHDEITDSPREDAHLLNGPALPDAATNQNDIDALFDSLG